ncbi:MAG TPA: hypothetical protein VI111_07590 [Thermoleophilaceae bacterium]
MEQVQLMEQVVRGHAQQEEFVSLRVIGSASEVIPRIERIDAKPIGWVTQRYKLPQDAGDLIELARKVRNEMAHEFFASIDTHSNDGRSNAIGRLLAASQIFGAASQAIYRAHAVGGESV